MNQIYRVPSDGLEIAAETFGEGEPLVFAHGLTGNRHIARQQMMPLADRYRIVIYDQRGHCDSTPVTDPQLYVRDRMAEDMAAVLDFFKIDRAIVGGESMGAETTLTFALKYPARVKKLLLTAPAISDEPNPDAQHIRDMGHEINELGMSGFLKNSAKRMTQVGATPQVIATLAEMHSSHDPASLAAACINVIDWTMDDFSRISELGMPACIIAWPNDPLHPFELAQRVADLLPNARLEQIASLVALFADPAQVGRIYRRFLEGLD